MQRKNLSIYLVNSSHKKLHVAGFAKPLFTAGLKQKFYYNESLQRCSAGLEKIQLAPKVFKTCVSPHLVRDI